MPEHTIPEQLIDQLRRGRAALVVGAGIGIPSWKQLLERINDELRSRGQDGDEVAARDVDKLLHKGNLVRAAGFLARTVGEAACDRHVADIWSSTEGETPDVARALARLPFKQVWTTFPGNALELAMEQEKPEDWPSPRVVTYKQAGSIDKRRRTLLKVLGDFDSFIVTPKSIRAALSGADALREFIHDVYVDGTLILVGFRYGDPDLSALLDRVFGSFEPPESHHYLVASGVGPVTVDELEAEHHMQVINLPGKGADEKATHALLDFLGSLRGACEAAGVTLSQARPDDDDLDAWLALWADDPNNAEARDAVLAIEAAARDAGDSERLIEALMSRAEIEDESTVRAGILRQVAEVFETQIGDLPGAFTALTAALRELPSDTSSIDEAERLAEATDGWAELVGDVSEVTSEIEDPNVAAMYWAKLGNWYHHKLSHLDYAVASFSQSLKRNPNAGAHQGLENVYRVQQRWTELAESLAAHVELVGSAERVPLLLSLGELCETQLASPSRAVDAYQQAADIDPTCDDALVALERIYRREERWGKLAKVLESRADVYAEQGDAQRASLTRRELATLRAEKLGDLEGAITKYESQLESHAHDVDALRALEDLYEKVGRNEEYLRTLERLADVVPDSERPQMLRRLAAELEDKEGGRDKAIECYRTVLDLEPQAEDAYRALARLYRSEARWHDLVDSIEQHLNIVKAPAPRADLFVNQANIYEKRLDEPERAIEAHLNALGAIDDHRDSIDALSRLYKATDQWQRATDTLVQLAKLEGEAGADYWAEAGRITAEQLDDPDIAERHFEKARELTGGAHLGALLGLAKLHRARGAWANAVRIMVLAEQASTNRLERIQLLIDAADIREKHLEDNDGALGLLLKVLELDPEHTEAGIRAGDRLMEASRYEEALPILEALARSVDANDPVAQSQRTEQLGRVCAALGHRQKAIKHYRTSVTADPENVNAAFGLAATLLSEASEIGAAERWQETYKAYRDILARLRNQLDSEQVAFTWHRIGLSAFAMKDYAKAEDAYRRALEFDAASDAVLSSLVDVTNATENWTAVIDAKNRQAELLDASEQTRFSLYEEIGDIAGGKLNNRDLALDAYKKAITIHPDSHQILHKTLDIHSETRNWRQAVDILDAIAETAKDPKRRAKYFYTAAVIARDELGSSELGIEYFSKAIEENPDIPKAFDALEQLLTEKQDWKPLARLYRKVLKGMGDDAPAEMLLRMWGQLGDVCIDHLDDPESAMTAYEVALSLDPDDIERHEQLANLYLEAGDSRRHEAIEQLQILIHHNPDRVELYRALSELYLSEGEMDKAYCLAQALVFLGAANDAENDLYTRLRPRQFVLAKHKLTEELWQKSIIHHKEDRHLNAIFAQVVGSIAATTAQPPSAFNIGRTTDPGRDKRPVTKVFQYATNILGLEPQPQLAVQPGQGEGVRVANTADKGKLIPTVVVGDPQADKTNERELAFEVGKRLAYFRPERYVHYALQTLTKLESAYYAALSAAGAKNAPSSSDGDIGKLSEHLKKTVPGAVLEQVGAVANRMNVPPGNGVVAGWRTATDLTANRVGLILCNDLETAARVVATEPSGMSPLSAKDRLRDLLAYAVSEEYFSVRRHLGIAVNAG